MLFDAVLRLMPTGLTEAPYQRTALPQNQLSAHRVDWQGAAARCRRQPGVRAQELRFGTVDLRRHAVEQS